MEPPRCDESDEEDLFEDGTAAVPDEFTFQQNVDPIAKAFRFSPVKRESLEARDFPSPERQVRPPLSLDAPRATGARPAQPLSLAAPRIVLPDFSTTPEEEEDGRASTSPGPTKNPLAHGTEADPRTAANLALLRDLHSAVWLADAATVRSLLEAAEKDAFVVASPDRPWGKTSAADLPDCGPFDTMASSTRVGVGGGAAALVNLPNLFGHSALLLAVSRLSRCPGLYTEVVSVLLEKSADIKYVNGKKDVLMAGRWGAGEDRPDEELFAFPDVEKLQREQQQQADRAEVGLQQAPVGDDEAAQSKKQKGGSVTSAGSSGEAGSVGRESAAPEIRPPVADADAAAGPPVPAKKKSFLRWTRRFLPFWWRKSKKAGAGASAAERAAEGFVPGSPDAAEKKLSPQGSLQSRRGRQEDLEEVPGRGWTGPQPPPGDEDGRSLPPPAHERSNSLAPLSPPAAPRPPSPPALPSHRLHRVAPYQAFWSPLDEAVSQKNRSIVELMLLKSTQQQQLRWRKRQESLAQALVQRQGLPETFYSEIEYHVELAPWNSQYLSVPLGSIMGPSDSVKIWKKGGDLRIDSTLVSWRKVGESVHPGVVAKGRGIGFVPCRVVFLFTVEERLMKFRSR